MAASDPRMMGEVVRSNADEVGAALEVLCRILACWRDGLRASPPVLPPEWERLAARRRALRFLA